MDFFKIRTREIEKGPNRGQIEIYPDFIVGRSQDLMVRGRSFYAVWDEEQKLWSQDEYAVQRLVDAELQAYADKHFKNQPVNIKRMQSASSGMWFQFRKFMQNISDNSHQLDTNLTFVSTETKKSDYVSRRLSYDVNPGEIEAWDELVGTLYNSEERAKIEWIIGAILAGDSKKIQKFAVFYGPGGKGKSTIIGIIEKLFEGYVVTFDAKALGSQNGTFATEVFKNNPLVAIQHDGDLSKIMDNTLLNSIVAHEPMRINEKYKAGYSASINAFCIMGTNQPVKITDAKSGLIRRLIDIHPTGVTIPIAHYFTLLGRVDFELGAIAHHCLQVYQEMGKNYFEGYRPLEMMLQTDIFFNFIEAHYDIFKSQDSTTLKQAYLLYKEWCADTGIEKPLPQYKVRGELQNYFADWKERAVVDGVNVRSFYTGFSASKFKTQTQPGKPFSLQLDETESLFDREFWQQPAQEASPAGTPKVAWASVKTTLMDLDTSVEHFVKVPESHIVIDFDLKGEDGEKSLERNLEAASVWPATYAELSKSGRGVHLHYNYTLDPSDLRSDFSEGIEVKIFKGNASLRRRLSRCNTVPIAELSGGLPLKEKKVLTDTQIKSEKGLRSMIIRNMNKEFGATKPSVDFILKILDEAYDSGMVYDVTDLKSQIIAFANGSTNQPIQSLKQTMKMKFRSEIGPEDVAEQQADIQQQIKDDIKEQLADERIVFFDVEVFINLFLIVWKFQGSDDFAVMVNPKPHEVEELLKFKLVGFNNRRYDNHILWGAMLGLNNEELYRLSQKMIVTKDKNAPFGQAYDLSYADIYDFAATKMSQKKWQIKLGIRHKELGLPWDEPVAKKDMQRVIDYCKNDVGTLEPIFEHLQPDFRARQMLADLSGLTVNDTTAKHTARIIFNGERNPQQHFVYTKLAKEFPGYEFDYGKSSYRGENPSEGGYVYAEEGMYENVAVLDVASMHPTSLIQLNLFGDYTPNFTALMDARLAIKRGDFDSASNMLNGKLAPHLGSPEEAASLSYALKIVINTVYGLTSAKFDNPFRDRRNVDNIVAKRGALFMIDLKLACQEKGLKVVHIKTDSIKIPDASPEDIAEIIAFGEKYGYVFEHETTYSKFCLVNDAVYIARKQDGNWDAVGAQFAKPYVFKQLFTHEDIVFDDLCETKAVVQGDLYLDFEHETPDPTPERMHFVGKTGLFVPVAEGQGGGMLYRVKDGKAGAAQGTKGHLWLEADVARDRGDDLQVDQTYFDKLVDSAYKQIEKYGDFESFVS